MTSTVDHEPAALAHRSQASSAAADTPLSPLFSPLYRQIKQLILDGMRHGEWKPGEAIPSEMELAARYKVSQGTVRKAIDELANEHLVKRQQGRGTFVASHAERQAQYRFLRLRADVSNAGSQAPLQREFIDFETHAADVVVGSALGMCVGEPVFRARRLLRLEGAPVILEDIWLPTRAFIGLTAERLMTYRDSTYVLFESEFGVRMVRAEEKIRACMPDALQASLLQVDTEAPVLSIERVAYTYDDVPMEFRHGLYRSDHYHYHNKLN